MIRRIALLWLLLPGTVALSAQPRAGFAYLDADRLYDTVPSPFYRDDDFTPQGRLAWNDARYRRKIACVAATVDSLAMPFVALGGVENESVVRDLVEACRGDYSYVHRTLNTLDGLDFALLYYGDQFFPDRVEPGRKYLYIEGEWRGERLGILLCGDPKMVAWVVRDLRDERPEVRLIVAGRVSLPRDAASGLRNVTRAAEKSGRGTAFRNRGWEMRDRLWIDTTFRCSGGDVFVRPYLVDQKRSTPIATYEQMIYRGGAGRYLPVFVYIM